MNIHIPWKTLRCLLPLLLCLLGTVRPARATLADGLIGHWSFDSAYDDGGVTKIPDLSGNGYDLKLRGAASLTSDPERGMVLNNYSATQSAAAEVDGPTGDLDIAPGSFTISLWFNRMHQRNNQGGSGYLIGAHYIAHDNQGWLLGAWHNGDQSACSIYTFNSYAHSTGVSTLYGGMINGSGWDSTWGEIPGVENPVLSMNTWHHAVVTYDESSPDDGTCLYIDGRLIRQGSNIMQIIPTAYPFAIGCGGLWNNTNQDPHDCFPGLIDETRIYSRALSGSEVAQLTGGETVPEPATLLAGLAGLAGIGRYLRRRK